MINSAKICPPKMMCKDERDDNAPTDANNNSSSLVKESWQDFIPSVTVPFWPEEAIEWYLRKRKQQRRRNNSESIQRLFNMKFISSVVELLIFIYF